MGEDLDRLQGNWNIVSLEMDGQEMSGGDARIVVQGNRFTSIAMGATYEGTVKVDETTSPKSFDLRFDEGPEKGNRSLGIYELNGDEWKICLTTRGTERPKKFAAPPGTGIALETLRRGPAAEEPEAPAASPAASLVMGEFTYDLVGEWVPLSLVRDGQPLEEGLLKFGKRTATVDQVTVKFGAQVMVQARYDVDRSPRPMTMDYFLKGGKTQLGIWELQDNRLTTCFAAPGQPRPTEFASVRGDGRTLTVWVPAGQ
jgi:uncharacterized protein (TIGR03067 family)